MGVFAFVFKTSTVLLEFGTMELETNERSKRVDVTNFSIPSVLNTSTHNPPKLLRRRPFAARRHDLKSVFQRGFACPVGAFVCSHCEPEDKLFEFVEHVLSAHGGRWALKVMQNPQSCATFVQANVFEQDADADFDADSAADCAAADFDADFDADFEADLDADLGADAGGGNVHGGGGIGSRSAIGGLGTRKYIAFAQD